MDKRNFDKALNTREQRYMISKKLNVCLMGINLILAVGLVMSINREKIILVPQVAPEMKLFVTQSQVSNSYLSELSRNVLDLLLNVTPNNVDAQHQELLKLVASR